MNRREFLALSGGSAAAAILPSLPARARVAGADISIRWLGAAMLELDIGGVRLLTDPCLGDGEEAFQMGDPNEMFDLSKGPNVKAHRRLTPFPGMALSGYDAVLLSHAHEDHFDQKAQAWLGGQGPVICPAHDAPHLSSIGVATEMLPHGQMRSFVKGNTHVRIMSLPAVHSLSPSVSEILGLGNGYWIEAIVGGRTEYIYWAGDTFMAVPVMQGLEGMPAPNLFIRHIGSVGTTGALGQLSMNGAQAVDFAARIGAARVLPVHHSTYELYLEPVSAMVEAHQATGSPASLNVIGEGASLRL